MMADMHAITVPHEPKELLASTRSTTALYLACGIDPSKSSLFVQSHVTAHAELAWLLQCYTPIGWLRKMIQFKAKSEKQVGSAALFSSPAALLEVARKRSWCQVIKPLRGCRAKRSARGC